MDYSLFEDFVKELLVREGGYVNNPKDSGGETNFGITVAVAKANGYTGPMRALPESLAKKIYKAKYWDVLALDSVQNLCPGLCHKLADISVNMGPKTAGTWLQRLLNVLNQEQRIYADLKVDGQVGPATIAALRAYMKHRVKDGETVMIRGLNCLQGAFYVSLAERRQKDEAFIYGWLLNRIN